MFFLYRHCLVNINKIFILNNFITANIDYAQLKDDTSMFIEKLNETTNTCKGITNLSRKSFKIYALIRYLKFVKKKYLRFLIFENQYLTEKLIFYHLFEEFNAFIVKTFEYCVLNTDHFPSSVFRALNLMPSVYSKYYMKIIVDILEYSLQNRLGLLFYFLLTYKYYTYKKKLTIWY